MVQKTALVAGGAGFIGSNLCANLLKKGYWVDCVDNFITSQIQTIKPLFHDDKFRLVEADVCDNPISSRLASREYSLIFDLACPTGVPNIALLGKEMLLTSSLGTLNLLMIAKRCAAKFLFASSAEVYGNAQITPQVESYTGNVDPTGPRSAYEEGKRFGEALTALFAKTHGVDARIVRIFNTYGPGMSLTDTRVIPSFIVKTLTGRSLTVFGNGKQTRCFLYVDDLIDALHIILERGSAGTVYNVGGNRETSVLELAELVQSLCGKDLKIQRKPHFIEDHERRLPDIARAGKLGWKPRTSLSKGLRASIAEMQARLEGETRHLVPSSSSVMAPAHSLARRHASAAQLLNAVQNG
jgi:nucleoside-diphosphate-sugar epimerase